MHWLGKDGVFWKLVVTYDQRAGRSMMILPQFYGRRMALSCKDLFCFTVRISMKPDDPSAYCRMAAPDGEKEGVVVTTLDGLMDHLLLVFLSNEAVTVENGQVMELDEWKEQLALRAERTAQVSGMGGFQSRRHCGHFPADRRSAGAY